MALIRNVAINSFCNDNFCGLSAFMRHRNETERGAYYRLVGSARTQSNFRRRTSSRKVKKEMEKAKTERSESEVAFTQKTLFNFRRSRGQIS